MNNQEETWKDIPLFNGLHQASNHGNIRKVSTNGKVRVCKITNNPKPTKRNIQPYKRVTING
jgi:hypothetical protein